MKRLVIFSVLLLFATFSLVAQKTIAQRMSQSVSESVTQTVADMFGSAESESEEVEISTELTSISWGRNQIGLLVPKNTEIAQETDSMILIEGPSLELYIYVEDRSIVTEESCAQFLFDEAKKYKASFASQPYFMMRDRALGAYLIGNYTDKEAGKCVLAQACYIDRLSRRIFTIQLFCTHDYDAVVGDIVTSLHILPEPHQY